jgi:PIN domain nuclease of toxin-antitoxin system
MNALLDTCAVLWAARQPERLSARVRALLLDPDTELTVSVVSAWEIALKPELGIVDVARWLREAARNLEARILPVRLEHIAALEKLPLRHRDPFDRLLLAQAVAGRLALVTSDQALTNYPEAVCIWD